MLPHQSLRQPPLERLLARLAFGRHQRTGVLRGFLPIMATSDKGSSLHLNYKQCGLRWTPAFRLGRTAHLLTLTVLTDLGEFSRLRVCQLWCCFTVVPHPSGSPCAAPAGLGGQRALRRTHSRCAVLWVTQYFISDPGLLPESLNGKRLTYELVRELRSQTWRSGSGLSSLPHFVSILPSDGRPHALQAPHTERADSWRLFNPIPQLSRDRSPNKCLSRMRMSQSVCFSDQTLILSVSLTPRSASLLKSLAIPSSV